MLTRIQRIMDEKQLSVSAFADEIGVKRPTMTHTMTGRNNPSLDIISKILERFQEVNSDWLLFGKGGMYKSNSSMQPGLFDDIQPHETEAKKVDDLPVIKEDHIKISGITSIAIEDDKYSKKSKEVYKKISKIMIFYSDNTFENFLPEDNPRK